MGSITLEILVLLLLIVANGFLAMSELAVVSARRPRLQQMVEAGSAGAKAALATAESPGQFLSTVQIGITLVGIFAGAFGGATVARWLAVYVAQIPGLAAAAEPIAVAMVVVVITYLSLVIGELAPKHIALRNAEGLAVRIAPFFQSVSHLAGPLVHLLNASTNGVLRLLRVPAAQDAIVSEEEVRLMLAQATEQGIFEPAEEELVDQVFRLADRRIEALMTPRTEMVWLDITAPIDSVMARVVEGGRSRYPVAEGRLDRVVGVVLAKDVLAQILAHGSPDLRAILRPALFIPESTPALKVIERFKATHSKIAVVIDEYGGVEGLVTIDDILGALVGDIPEEDEASAPEMVQRADGSWLIDGMLPIDEFQEHFGIDASPETSAGHYNTVGGFVMAALGRMPDTGDTVDWSGMRVEVLDMDGHRVDKVLVTQSTGKDAGVAPAES